MPQGLSDHLDASRIRRMLDKNVLLLDLRPPEAYLDAHVRGSISMLYEAGTGFGSRARDLLGPGFPVVLLDDGETPLADAASRLRAKGLEVRGVAQRLARWPPAEVVPTPAVAAEYAPAGLFLLDVSDPGMLPRKSSLSIPSETLWTRHSEIDRSVEIGVLAGWGVRAAAAVGILERLGFERLRFVRTRPEGATPPAAGPEAFRVGGPG